MKKDRNGKRRWRNAKGHFWNVPKSWIKAENRLYRTRIRQLMREGKHDALPRQFADSGYHYW